MMPRVQNPASPTIPGEPTEEAVIDRIVAGASEEFAVLVERYQTMVFGMIMRQVGARDIADELAQETFIKAFRNLGSFRRRSMFSTWLIRIALNQTSNYFSSRRFKESRRTESLDLTAHDRAADSNTGGDPRTALFHRALGALAPKFRDVVTVCGLEGRSYDDAAAILEVPIGTVRSRLNRARLMLKNEIERLEEGAA